MKNKGTRTALAALLILALAMLTACRATKVYTEQTTDRTHEIDSLMRTIYRLRQDSLVQLIEIHRLDSVAEYRSHSEVQKGDTIYVRDTIRLVTYRYAQDNSNTRQTRDDQRDSSQVQIQQKDSLQSQTIIETKEVRKRNGYDKFTSAGFWFLLTFNVLILVFFLYKKFHLR